MSEFEGIIVTFLDLVHSLTVGASQRRPLLCKRRRIFGALVTSCQTDIADEAAVCNAGEEFVTYCSIRRFFFEKEELRESRSH